MQSAELAATERKRYAELLTPLFSPDGVDTSEYAFALLRVGGCQDAGWDPLQESKEMLEDLTALTEIELPKEKFRSVEKMSWRLGLISYAHMTEMEAPYNVLANLLRVRSNLPFVTNPFRDPTASSEKTTRSRKRMKRTLFRPPPPISPSEQIRVIAGLADKAGLPSLAAVFGEFYFPPLRNAIAHSSYVLHQGEFRLLGGYLLDPNRNVHSPVVDFSYLRQIIIKTYAFYSAFFWLHQRARAGFGSLRGKCFPYDPRLKGLLEFLIEANGFLIGFRIHWPNKLDSVYRRTESGCEALNITFNPDHSVNFFVGEFFKDHHPLTPLVPLGGNLEYTSADGSTEPPTWPQGT